MNHSETKKLIATTGAPSQNVYAERVLLLNEAGVPISTKSEAELNSQYRHRLTQVVKSSNGTTALWDYVLASTGGGAIALTLPTGATTDDEVHIKNIGSNPVTVSAGALTIDGSASYVMNGKHEDQVFRFDGVNWRTSQSQLPLVFVQDQLDTEYNAAGGNDDFCLTIANQITTGAAADGVHDLVLLARNNPSIGDADIYVTRDDVNTTGVFYVHMPIKSAHGLQIQDSNSVALFDMQALVRLVQRSGKQGWCYNASAIRWHPGCKTAPKGVPELV